MQREQIIKGEIMDYYEKIKYIEMIFSDYKNIEYFYRFWDKIDIKDNIEEYWNWTACTDTGGYGMFKIYGDLISSHRTAYMLSKGPIPDELQVQHICNNRLCCNPNHLELGTTAKNSEYMAKCGRQNFQKLTEANIREIHEIYREQRKLHPVLKQWQITEPIAKKFGITGRHVNTIIRGLQ